MKTYSLAEMKDKYIGKAGTRNRDKYEYELHVVLLKINSTLRRQTTK